MENNTKEEELCSLGGGTLRPKREQRATKEESNLFSYTVASITDVDEGAGLNPQGSPVPDGSSSGEDSIRLENPLQNNPCPSPIVRIGTWNVRTMLRKGKLENLKREMIKLEINILGISEVRWKEGGDFVSDGFRVIYAGGMESQRGVGIVLDKETAKGVTKIVRIGDRILLVKIAAVPVDLVIIQVYMPTTDHEVEEVESLYEKLEDLIKQEKGKDYVVVMGDWNAIVGEERDGNEIGQYGLGVRNERGQIMVDFCKRMNLIVSNTWYKQPNRRRYTWKKPGDTGRFQLDYILVKQRFRNSVKSAKSYPGADMDSDHNLVLAKVQIKLKKIKRTMQRKKWMLQGLEKKAKSFQDKMSEWAKTQDRMNNSRNINEDWKEFSTAVIENAEAIIGYRGAKRAKKPWITEEMIRKMDDRRKWKAVNSDDGRKNYSRLNNELRRVTDKAREEWWKKECEELEKLNKMGRTDMMYAKVKEVTRTGKAASNMQTCTSINNSRGVLVSEVDEVKGRWKEYIEELYTTNKKPLRKDLEVENEGDVGEDSKGPELMDSEIREAIKELKKGKAVGCDGIPAELIKIVGEDAEKHLLNVCRKMYETGMWPEEFTKTIMIPLPKKQNAIECSDFRTISLIPHASKIMLRILTKRVQAKAEEFIGNSQFGFRKGCGTREAIGVMRMLCERRLELGDEVFVCFVDFEKAFDRVDWVKLMKVLKKLGIDWKDRRMIANLYLDQTTVVKIGDMCTDPSNIGRGVRQGCSLSPILFTIYAEMMMAEAMEGMDEGIVVGGKMVQDVRFADDQGMVANSEMGLQRMMDRLVDVAKDYNMKINVKKTKVMKVSRKGGGKVELIVEGQKVEQVTKFKYLGSYISEDGRCEEEIKVRIAMAKAAFSKRKELLARKMSMDVKKQIIKTVIWSVALYAAETWTLRKEDIRRINSLEMWLWRRMEKISWTERRTDEEVLRTVGVKREMVNVIIMRKKNWIGHILRHDGLFRDVMEGKMEGKRPRGRPRIGMLEELKEGSYVTMKRRAEDRERWKCWIPRTCH
jgi:hypothetical protein